jgi:hypothetical protein
VNELHEGGFIGICKAGHVSGQVKEYRPYKYPINNKYPIDNNIL